jgi:hypothetical protein
MRPLAAAPCRVVRFKANISALQTGFWDMEYVYGKVMGLEQAARLQDGRPRPAQRDASRHPGAPRLPFALQRNQGGVAFFSSIRLLNS